MIQHVENKPLKKHPCEEGNKAKLSSPQPLWVSETFSPQRRMNDSQKHTSSGSAAISCYIRAVMQPRSQSAALVGAERRYQLSPLHSELASSHRCCSSSPLFTPCHRRPPVPYVPPTAPRNRTDGGCSGAGNLPEVAGRLNSLLSPPLHRSPSLLLLVIGLFCRFACPRCFLRRNSGIH